MANPTGTEVENESSAGVEELSRLLLQGWTMRKYSNFSLSNENVTKRNPLISISKYLSNITYMFILFNKNSGRCMSSCRL